MGNKGGPVILIYSPVMCKSALYGSGKNLQPYCVPAESILHQAHRWGLACYTVG